MTIQARIRSRCSVRPDRTRAVNTTSSVAVRTMTNGLVIGIAALCRTRGDNTDTTRRDHQPGSQRDPHLGPQVREGGCHDEQMAVKFPESTKASVHQRLAARARERWPDIAELHVRHRGTFTYVEATTTNGPTLPLCRLRYVGSAHDWQVAIYRASHDDYQESTYPSGLPIGTCQDALDLACGLYLNDPTAWHNLRPPTN